MLSQVSLRVLRAAVLFACLAAAASPSVASASPVLRVEGPNLVDESGRVVVLRGVNVAGNSKVPPFRPVTGSAIFDPLVAWGMNVVRLLFTWEAYEPTRGVYDLSYLDYYASAVDAAASRGLFVIVDFHQDAFSRYTLAGCGEGFPAWAVPPWIPRATPDNGPSCWAWGATMIIDPLMHAAWRAFHSNVDGVRTRYVAMVESVARSLVGRRAVIGYDMINEPWGDEPTELRALYEEAGAAIRRADPTSILFVSPHALVSAGTQSKLMRPSFRNFVYSPHFYDGGVVVAHNWTGRLPDGPFGNMREIAAAWDVPLFVGEFGAAADTVNGHAYIHVLYDYLDATIASGAQWVYTPGWTPVAKDGWNGEDLSLVDDTGATRATFAARPYPTRVAGIPLRFALRGTTVSDRTVDLAWENAPLKGATELYVPEHALFGSAGMAVDATGAQIACTVSGNHVRCTSPVAGAMFVRARAAAPSPPPPLPPASTGCARAGGEAVAMPAFLLFASARRRARKSCAKPSNRK